jgi:hypothetical protein
MTTKEFLLEPRTIKEVFANAEQILLEINSAFSEMKKADQLPSKALKLKLDLLIKAIDSVILTVKYFQRSVSRRRPWK